MSSTLSDHARAQAGVWGTDPQGWAELAEGLNEPLFLAALDAAGVTAGCRLLDVGCGAGRLLQLALGRGATVTGLDVTEPLLRVAAVRAPSATLRLGELDALPFPADSFDVVTGVNAFQFAADPRVALAEAARVLVPGGRLVACLFAEPERCESTVIHHALSALNPAPAGAAPVHVPYLLSAPGNLERAISDTGLVLTGSGEVQCTWAYPDAEAAVRALLASAGGAGAVAAAGRDAAASAVRTAVRPFTAADSTIAMTNTYRWVSAEKSAAA